MSNNPPKKWYEDASYFSTLTPSNGKSVITFHFPNAAGGDLKFSTWLYKFKPKGDIPWHYEVSSKNLIAEMLQCYIDKPTYDIKPPTKCQKLRRYIKHLYNKLPKKV